MPACKALIHGTVNPSGAGYTGADSEACVVARCSVWAVIVHSEPQMTSDADTRSIPVCKRPWQGYNLWVGRVYLILSTSMASASWMSCQHCPSSKEKATLSVGPCTDIAT